MKQQHTLQPKLRFPEFEGGWSVTKLGNIMTFKNGVNASKENYGFGYKFINVLDIINNNIITNDLIIGEVNITEKEFQKNIVEKGDILFQRSSETREEVGQSNVYSDEIPATFGGFVIRGKAISEYNSLYLHYLLKTAKVRLEITNKSGGSTRYNVGQETLGNVVIYKSPSLSEQQKIADYLSTIDAKINLLEEKKEQLSRYKKVMMQKLFSQEVRFSPSNSEALETYPDWEIKKLDSIVDVRDGTHDSPKYVEESKYFLITSKNLSIDGSLNFNDIKYLKEDDYIKINQRSRVEEGDILFGMIGTIGNPVIVKGEVNFAIKNMALLKRSRLINTIFLYQLFRSSYIKNIFKRINTGNTQKFISLSQIRNLDILYPSTAEQQKIADFLLTIDESIEKVNEQITKTQSFKKAMLQQMFI